MSFLKQAYALEQEVLEEVVEPTGEEFVEVDAETETTRQEAEAMGEELDRAVAVHKELENQNDTVREILEQDGEITPATAAVLEVARRTAAAGLGLDPDQEGKELVDVAGLESLVATKSVVALEEAEKASKSLWEKIKALWNAFVAKVGEFWNWLMKLLDFVSDKNKSLANKLKAMDKEIFDRGLASVNAKLTEVKEKMIEDAGGDRFVRLKGLEKMNFAAFNINGKTADIANMATKALTDLNITIKTYDDCVEQAKKEIATKDGGSFVYLLKNIADKKFHPAEIDILTGNYYLEYYGMNISFRSRVQTLTVPKELKFSKEELANELLKMDKTCKEMRKYAEQAFKRYKNESNTAAKLSKETEKRGEAEFYQSVLVSRKNIFKAESAITRHVTRVVKSIASTAQEIINASGYDKKEEK